MLSRSFINRAIILVFMGTLGFCLAKALYHKSVMGIILAVISLVAAIWFLVILVKEKERMKTVSESVEP